MIPITDEERERARLMSEEKYELDLQSFVNAAMRKGWDGHDVKVFHAKRMKETYARLEEIVYVTGLSVEEIEKL